MTQHPEKIIVKKLLGGFFVLLLLYISFAFRHYYQTDLFSELTTSIYNHPLVVSNAALEGNTSIIEMHRSMKDVALLDSNAAITKAITDVYELERRVLEHLDIISQKILGEEGKQLESEARKLFLEWEEIRQEVILLARAGQREAAARITMTKSADHVARLEEKMQAIAANARGKATDFNRQADKAHSRVHLYSAIYIIAVIFLSIIIAFITIKRVLASERKSFENLDLLQAILEGIDDLIHVKDAEGRWLLSNTATAKALARNPEELIGKKNNDILSGDILQQADDTDQEIMSSGESISFEQKMPVKGSAVTYLSKKTALLDKNDKVIGVINVSRDVTERVKTRDELERELMINSALSSLYVPLTRPESTLKSITDKIHEQALQLAASEFAYVSSIDPANGDLIGHTLSKMRGNHCKLATTKAPTIFKCGEDGLYNGLWGHSLNRRKPFFTNAPETHKSSAGTPSGHIPIKNFISVPVMVDGELVGQIAAANKKTDYTCHDIIPLVRLGEYFALALQRKRAEGLLKRNKEELKEQVEKRTAGLVTVNEKLEQEIIERKRKTYALMESEHKYSTLVENAIVGIFIVQNDSIKYANPRFAEIFGYTIDQLIGMDPCNLIHPDESLKFKEDFVHAMNGNGDPGENLQRGLSQDKKLRWLEMRKTIIPFEGKPAILGNIVDVTRRKELEHLINIKDKMTSLGRVAAGIAHELRNPLSGMNIHLTNLERLCLHFDDLEPAAKEQNLTRIIDNLKIASSKIESVVKRVYDFSKASMFNVVQIDVNKSINTVIEISSTALRKNDISLEKRLEQHLPPCFSNKNLFEQLIMNLLTNASQILEGVDHKRKILITSTALNENIIIKVADSGPGIQEHMRDKIFDPFFSSKKDGLGIGLSICYRIVKDHGGELTLGGSEELGGAEFTITLPRKIQRNG